MFMVRRRRPAARRVAFHGHWCGHRVQVWRLRVRSSAGVLNRQRPVSYTHLIAVVVVWHTVMSLTYRKASGTFSMPNPLDEIPLGWAATWVLQVMPMFFIVGGFANARSWDSSRRRGDGAGHFVRTRICLLYTSRCV